MQIRKKFWPLGIKYFGEDFNETCCTLRSSLQVQVRFLYDIIVNILFSKKIKRFQRHGLQKIRTFSCIVFRKAATSNLNFYPSPSKLC